MLYLLISNILFHPLQPLTFWSPPWTHLSPRTTSLATSQPSYFLGLHPSKPLPDKYIYTHTRASQVAQRQRINLLANAGDARDSGSIPGSGRSPGVGNGNPLQYSCLENSLDRGAWLATVHGVAKSHTWLSNWTHTHMYTHMYIRKHMYMSHFPVHLKWKQYCKPTVFQ